MAKTVNWGILGASNFALNHMGPAIHSADSARLAALATGSEDKAGLYLASFPGLKIHQTYEQLLDDADIDAVYIPLPNHLHVEWVLKALDAGKHVLCEKPIAMNAPEIDRLIEKRNQTGLLAAEAYMIVHHPQWQRAKALYEQGVLGELIQVDAFFSYYNDDSQNIRNRAETGGGGIRDIGVYTYGSVRYVTGQEPTKITHTNMVWENGVDTYAQILADFPGFNYASMTSTRAAVRQEVVFHGTQGVMKVTAPFNAELFAEPKVELYQENHVDLIERFPGVNQYRNQVEAFGECVRSGQAYPWRLEDSQGTQRMIDMVFEAAGDR